MGLCYFAVDHEEKKFFSPPEPFNNKSPGIFHPENPFPGMVIMMNVKGNNYEIWDDAYTENDPPDDYDDITDETYKEYLEIFKDYFSELERK